MSVSYKNPWLRLPLALSLLCIPAFAQTLSFPNFSSTSGLTLKGSATTTTTSDGVVIRLTTTKCCSAGSAFTTAAVPFVIPADTFSTFFQFRITNPGGIDPADGIVFALRDSPQSLGGTGGSQGYVGIGNSVAVKLDTYQNEGEINNNHVSILTNGQVTEADAQTPYGVSNCHQPVNGHLWSVWIDFDGASIHVALADNSTTRPADLIDAPLSIPLLLTAGNAWVGFTAGTGGGYENHDIVDWQYYNTFNPTPVGNPQVLPTSLISQVR